MRTLPRLEGEQKSSASCTVIFFHALKTNFFSMSL
jgi:hypothetical protein